MAVGQFSSQSLTKTPEPGRIAYFSAQAVAEGQDTWAAVMETIRAIEREGWSVDLYCPRYEEGSVPGFFVRLWRIAAVQLRLAARIKCYDALYVRVHPLAWPIANWARLFGVAVIQESNGSWEDAFMAWPSMRQVAPLVVALQRSQYRHADAIVAVSATLAEWLRKETGRDDVVISPNGANDELFCPDSQRPSGLPERYVVFFGQFAPWQRIDVLLEAATLPEWPEDIDLVLVGDGALRPEVEAAEKNNARIHYLGKLPYVSVPGIVANAVAATVLTYAPERAGYSPLKLYEAMACGVPIICSDTPGQAEYVREERSGIVVPPGDALAVAQAVASIAADPVEAQAMGHRGVAAIEEKYSWEARARQRLGVVAAAVRSKQARG